MDKLLNIIFLQSCYICGKFGRLLCEDCFSKFPVLKSGFCVVCDKPSLNGFTHKECKDRYSPSRLISFFSYEGLVRESILRSKFDKKEFMTIKLFSIYTFEKYAKYLKNYSGYHVTAVPLSKEKFTERGFNQADLIAKIYCKINKNPFVSGLLVRTKNTSPQFGNSRKARFENVTKVFKVSGGGVGGRAGSGMPKKVLLIDDITTSGATFLSATRSLKEAGVQDVVCLSLSKKLFENTDVIM